MPLKCYSLVVSCEVPLRILVVDDAPLVRKMMSRLLLHHNLKADEATNGAEAIAKVKLAMSVGQSYDVILMDSSMRIMGGPEATRAIRKLGFSGKIFGVTGHSDEGSIDDFLAKGADKVILKPMTKDTLTIIIEGTSK